jgi:hypothetical protein
MVLSVFPDYASPISTGPANFANFSGRNPPVALGLPCSVTLFGNVTFNTWRQVEIARYEPPADCPPPWTSVQLEFIGEVAGVQYDRVGALWLGGVELLRTTTPEPTGYDESGRARRAVRWHIARSLHHYQALFLHAATVELSIPNVVNANYTGNISVSSSLKFISAAPPPDPAAPVPSPLPLLRDGSFSSAKADEEAMPAPIAPPAASVSVDVSIAAFADLPPADEIVPLVLSTVVASDAAITPWERLAIATTSAPNMSTRVTISERTAVRAVLDVYVSPHGCEEFWYSNVPNALGGEGVCAGGAYREVEVLVDGIFAGAAFPFPVIYSGGINPVLWRPIAGLHSLNVPPLSFDLTPFVGVMDDGLPHTIDVRIAPAQGSQSSGTWYVDPVLRLWHAADGLTRTGRVVKAERVAVSTTANVERLAGDSVRVLTSEVD